MAILIKQELEEPISVKHYNCQTIPLYNISYNTPIHQETIGIIGQAEMTNHIPQQIVHHHLTLWYQIQHNSHMPQTMQMNLQDLQHLQTPHLTEEQPLHKKNLMEMMLKLPGGNTDITEENTEDLPENQSEGIEDM